MKNSGFKHSEVFNLIVNREAGYFADCVKKVKILAICRKHSEAVDAIYTELIGLDIFEQ